MLLDALQRATNTLDGTTEEEWHRKPNRADARAAGRRRGHSVTRARAAPHPLASDGLTEAQRATQQATEARLNAAHAHNEALPEDAQAPWISPEVEQGYRDRRANRKRERAARRRQRRK